MADGRRPATCSSPPARPGTSRCSAGTASGPRGCCCRSAPTSPRARCARWPPAGHPRSTRRPRRSRARSCTSCAAALARRRPRPAPAAVYYGTVDATPLWICLLHDAWRWGMPADQVEPLLPHLEAALGWLAEHGDADGDGFLRVHRHQPATAWPTRAGRTPATPSASPTAASPSRRSRCARCRGTPTRRPSAGPPCWTPSAGPAASGWRDWAAALGRAVPGRVLGRGRRRPVPGAGPGRRQAAGRLADQQHRPPAGHRPARRRRGGAGRRAARRARPRLAASGCAPCPPTPAATAR